jgi:hypothetical protein
VALAVIALLARLPLAVLMISWLTASLDVGVELLVGVECRLRMAPATKRGCGGVVWLATATPEPLRINAELVKDAITVPTSRFTKPPPKKCRRPGACPYRTSTKGRSLWC